MSDTTNLVVVDTSVAFKWFSPEGEHSVAEALELLAAHGRGKVRLCAPAIMPVELLNALRYSGWDATALAEAADSLEEAGVELFATDAPLLTSAARIAEKDGLTVYDAVFAALAAELECVLVTAERRQSRTSACAVRLL